MELETVPDTEDYILLDKIGMGMGVYSGVYEYTQQIQEQIQSIQSIQGIWAFAELQAGSLQYNTLHIKLINIDHFWCLQLHIHTLLLLLFRLTWVGEVWVGELPSKLPGTQPG